MDIVELNDVLFWCKSIKNNYAQNNCIVYVKRREDI